MPALVAPGNGCLVIPIDVIGVAGNVLVVLRRLMLDPGAKAPGIGCLVMPIAELGSADWGEAPADGRELKADEPDGEGELGKGCLVIPIELLGENNGGEYTEDR